MPGRSVGTVGKGGHSKLERQPERTSGGERWSVLLEKQPGGQYYLHSAFKAAMHSVTEKALDLEPENLSSGLGSPIYQLCDHE